jgi:hypothetical protein
MKLVTTNVPSSLILLTLMLEAVRCSETSVLTRATRRHFSVDGIPLQMAAEQPQLLNCAETHFGLCMT